MPQRRVRARLSMAERVDIFEVRYAELCREPYARADVKLVLRAGPGVVVESTARTEQEFRSYLMLLRQFISPAEPIHIGFLLNQLPRYIDDAELRERLAECRSDWRVAERKGRLGIVMNGQSLTGRAVTNLLLNGTYFHSDPDLVPTWLNMSAGERGMNRFRFDLYVHDTSQLLAEVHAVIQEARGRNLMRADSSHAC